MAEEGKSQSIIIKKVKKGGHAAHGGAWKIAYADFVTAMMAFFLLLWLLNSVTQEQLEGISNYFAPVAASSTTSGAGEILGGSTISEPGALRDTTSRPKVTMDLPPPKAGAGLSEETGKSDSPDDVSDEAAQEKMRQKEEEQFQEAKKALEDAIQSVPSLKSLADNLLVDDTPEGLRIQLVDQEGQAMFPSGKAELYLHTKKILELVATVIQSMPQKISISGHTDATRFAGSDETGYGNWELSADRANAARRYLVHLKVPEERISRVVGKADTEPLLPDNPTHASNRRLSIILLRGTGEQKPEDESLPGLHKARTGDTGGGAAAPPAPAPASKSDNEVTIPMPVKPAPAKAPEATPAPAADIPFAPAPAPEPAPEPEAMPQEAPPAAQSGTSVPARRQIVIPLGKKK